MPDMWIRMHTGKQEDWQGTGSLWGGRGRAGGEAKRFKSFYFQNWYNFE